MVFFSESQVRRWIAVLGLNTRWTEPNRGGSVGSPDVTVSIQDKNYELELKVWERLKRNQRLKAVMEPTQVRYHYVKHRDGGNTLLIIGEQGTDLIWVLPGSRAPRKISDQIDTTDCFKYGYKEGDAFVADLKNRRFWWNGEGVG